MDEVRNSAVEMALVAPFLLLLLLGIFGQALLDQAELEAAAVADSLATLAARNTDLEDQLRGYNMQIILLNDEVDRMQEVVDAKLAVVEGLADENEELLARIRMIELQLAEKDEELEAAVLSMEEIREKIRLQRGAIVGALRSGRLVMLLLMVLMMLMAVAVMLRGAGHGCSSL